jgi:hypothetical protein
VVWSTEKNIGSVATGRSVREKGLGSRWALLPASLSLFGTDFLAFRPISLFFSETLLNVFLENRFHLKKFIGNISFFYTTDGRCRIFFDSTSFLAETIYK